MLTPRFWPVGPRNTTLSPPTVYLTFSPPMVYLTAQSIGAAVSMRGFMALRVRVPTLAWYGVGADTDWIPADCSDTSKAGHGAKFGRGKVCTDTYTAAAAAYNTSAHFIAEHFVAHGGGF